MPGFVECVSFIRTGWQSVGRQRKLAVKLGEVSRKIVMRLGVRSKGAVYRFTAVDVDDGIVLKITIN